MSHFISKVVLSAVVSATLLASSKVTFNNPDEAIKRLKEGNARFVRGKSIHPHTDMKRIKETKGGQKPFVTMTTCSDSRVPLERVFDQGIGDMFIIRVAGNVSDIDEAGSIEYGTDHLGTGLVVIVGHTSCGAVTAVASGAHVTGNIPRLVDNIVPAVKKVQARHEHESYDKWLGEAIEENVWQSIEDLLYNSSTVKHLVQDGKVKIVGAIYDIGTGKVKFMGEHPHLKELLETKHVTHSSSKSAEPFLLK